MNKISNTQQKTVLIVDDTPENITILGELLGSSGIRLERI